MDLHNDHCSSILADKLNSTVLHNIMLARAQWVPAEAAPRNLSMFFRSELGVDSHRFTSSMRG